MKAGLTIQEMSKEILRQSQAKTDYLVNTANLRMEPWGNEPMLRVLDANGRDQVEPLTMKQTAHQQLGSYLDIPRKYYDRMLQQEPDLLAYNVNHWFQKQPEQRMIRTIDGHARAFLSNRYRRIDNLDIAKVTLPIIAEMPDARYESCQITDDYMSIKVVNPRLTAEVVPGDIVQADRTWRRYHPAFELPSGVFQRHGGQRRKGQTQPCRAGHHHGRQLLPVLAGDAGRR